ncbi:hypothetical protein HG530_007071 [Fusarium avenaceum]|nr:hypothetical protein HG530_007071 [Fusarium avenaceum]
MKFSNLLSVSFAFSSTVAGLPSEIGDSAISAVEKRAFAGPPVCHYAYRNHLAHFNNGIGEVRNLNRVIAFAPRFCVRVTCSRSAGIANPHRVVNLHTNTIYDYYVRIAEGPGACIFFGSSFAGQQFDTDGWNVIAIKMNCDAPSVWTVDQWPAQP